MEINKPYLFIEINDNNFIFFVVQYNDNFDYEVVYKDSIKSEGITNQSGRKISSVLFLKHALLAQTLDKEEIEIGVGTIAAIADELDDELQNEFGGQKAID